MEREEEQHFSFLFSFFYYFFWRLWRDLLWARLLGASSALGGTARRVRGAWRRASGCRGRWPCLCLETSAPGAATRIRWPATSSECGRELSEHSSSSSREARCSSSIIITMKRRLCTEDSSSWECWAQTRPAGLRCSSACRPGSDAARCVLPTCIWTASSGSRLQSSSMCGNIRECRARARRCASTRLMSA